MSTPKQLSIAEISAMLAGASGNELDALLERFETDPRSGVQKLCRSARRRFQAEAAERDRLEGLYAFDRRFLKSKDGLLIGIDEVGRGPLAGPLCVGAVVLPSEPHIPGLNDSKQLKPSVREVLSQCILQVSLFHTVIYIEPEYIDDQGMASALRFGFSRAVEECPFSVDTVLIDGNPLHIHEREVNVIKGDTKSAAIAAASIIAKVERDRYMCSMDEVYPVYGFAASKGYGTAAHIAAIQQHGLCPLHRKSFCRDFMEKKIPVQDKLFQF